MQMNTYQLTGKCGSIPSQKGDLGETEKRGMICQWYRHSKEVNQSAVHGQRGASIARPAADETHQVLLEGEGGQTKGWNVPNCLVSISSSQ